MNPSQFLGELVLDPEPHNVGEARRFVTRCLQGVDIPEEHVHTAVLITSEVVTNAVQHAATTLSLRLYLDNSEIRIDVEDASRRQLDFREASPSDIGGRGLELVAHLAKRHGSDVIPGDGKHVWFTVVRN